MLPRGGLQTDDDLATVTVFLPMATSQETMANLAATDRLAIVTTHPISHCATQLKGIAQRTRPARETSNRSLSSTSRELWRRAQHHWFPAARHAVA